MSRESWRRCEYCLSRRWVAWLHHSSDALHRIWIPHIHSQDSSLDSPCLQTGLLENYRSMSPPPKLKSALKNVRDHAQCKVDCFPSRGKPTSKSKSAAPFTTLTIVAQGPIPLVWGFRRARRARPLPPAYVLMYHCDGKIETDRSLLRKSLVYQYAPDGRTCT